MAEKSRQHIVPRSYLRAWADASTPSGQEPYVWVFPAKGGMGRRKAPVNLFLKRDFYTRTTQHGARDVAVEDELAEIEEAFVSIRDQVLANHLFPDEDERYLLCEFVAAMYARNEVQQANESAMWRKVLSAIDEFGRKRGEPLRTVRIGRWEDGVEVPVEEIEAHLRQPTPTSVFTHIQVQPPILMELDLMVLETEDPIGFITSDNPCIWVGTVQDPDGSVREAGLAHPTIEVFLPVSPRQVLFMNRKGHRGVHSVPSNFVNGVNRNTCIGAQQHIVVNQNKTKSIWFESPPGPKPDPATSA